MPSLLLLFFFFNDTATTEIYTLSLHDALPIYRAEHLFAHDQALALYDAYHEKASACDVRIEAVLKELSIHRGRDHGSTPPASRRRNRTDQANALASDVRAAAFEFHDLGLQELKGVS